MADFSHSSDTELLSLNAQVVSTTRPQEPIRVTNNALQLADPEEFEHWDKLVQAAQLQEGGLNRNSSPQAIASTREVYDRFLARCPLFFGYWKKYADLEFAIAGTEAADLVSTRIQKEDLFHRTNGDVRCTSVVWQASPILWICGRTTATSRPKRTTIQKRSASKSAGHPFPSCP